METGENEINKEYLKKVSALVFFNGEEAKIIRQEEKFNYYLSWFAMSLLLVLSCFLAQSLAWGLFINDEIDRFSLAGLVLSMFLTGYFSKVFDGASKCMRIVALMGEFSQKTLLGVHSTESELSTFKWIDDRVMPRRRMKQMATSSWILSGALATLMMLVLIAFISFDVSSSNFGLAINAMVQGVLVVLTVILSLFVVITRFKGMKEKRLKVDKAYNVLTRFYYEKG